jgi:hypothetical protein
MGFMHCEWIRACARTIHPPSGDFEVALFVPIPTRSVREGMTYDLIVMIHFRSLADASGYDFFPLLVRGNESAQLQNLATVAS